MQAPQSVTNQHHTSERRGGGNDELGPLGDADPERSRVSPGTPDEALIVI